MTHRLLLSVVAAGLLLPCAAVAGDQEERFVSRLAQSAIQNARAGHGSREVRAMRDILQDALDLEAFTRDSFGEHWGDLGFRQKDRAKTIVLDWSALAFAGSLSGREQLAIDGSREDGGQTRVLSTISVPGDDLGGPLPVEWIMGTHMGQPVVLDVIIGGKSSIESQRLLIEQLFEDSGGNAKAVLEGVSDSL